MNKNRIKTHFWVVFASIGLAILAAGLVVSLPVATASNAPDIGQNEYIVHEMQTTLDMSFPKGATSQAVIIPDSTYTEAVNLTPISGQDGLLLPDMVAQSREDKPLQDSAFLERQDVENGSANSAGTPTQIEAGEFAGINGAVCAYNNFTDTLAAAVNGDVIYIKQGTWTERIGTVNKNLTFAAANSNCTQLATGGVIIDGNDNAATLGGVIEVAANKNVTLSYLELTNGMAISGGIAAVHSGANLMVVHSSLNDGYAVNGGGVYIDGGSITLNDSSVFSNTAQTYGGGIYANYGPNIVIQNNSQVNSNLVSDYWGMGGGIYIGGDDGAITITQSAVMSNTASYAGGIRMIGDNLVKLLDDTELKYNQTVDGGGGAILASGGTLVIDDTQLEHNTAVLEGGALWSGTCDVSISNTSIFSNTAGNYGGGVFIGTDSTVDIENSQIVENEAQYWGGGVFVATNAILNVEDNSHIDENKTTDAGGNGGGIYISGNNSHITVTASTIMSNTAPYAGGGIRLANDSTLDLSDGVDVSYNQASSFGGGGLAVSVGTVVVDEVTFQHNSTNSNGGAIWVDSSDLTITDSSFQYNDAGDSGGGIFRCGGNLALHAIGQALAIAHNEADFEGGGIFDESGFPLILQATHGWPIEIVDNTSNYGGGVYIINQTSMQGLGEIVFSDNTARNSGGGLFVESLASVELGAYSSSVAPSFLSNEAVYDMGGGIYAINSAGVTLNGVTIGSQAEGNIATSRDGGGLYAKFTPITLTNTTFGYNQAERNGGAMTLYTSTLVMQSAYPTLLTGATAGIQGLSDAVVPCDPNLLPANQYCSQFSNNATTTGDGGAVYLYDSHASILNTAFLENGADSGAALYVSLSELMLSQARVSDNESYSFITPSIIHVDGGSEAGVNAILTTTYSTIVDNQGTALDYSPNTSGLLESSIIWGNENRGEIIPYATASCNNTQDRSLGGDNISQTPLFIETPRGDYHLVYFSPGVNACFYEEAHDLDGLTRPRGSTNDMGAFEALVPTLYLPVVIR
ncbi:MAG: hypothetical protein JW908_02480 [Anaerolineales bacterium]|nr:hypothetical protein [Anaerolineales bacterium]